MIPAAIQQTLDTLQGEIDARLAAQAALLALYTPGTVTVPAVAAPVPTPRPPKAPKAQKARTTTAWVHPNTGSQYDDVILRALRQESAAHGVTLTDVIRAHVGPGKPDAVKKFTGAFYGALCSLVKRGAVRKDGRHYYAIPTRDQEVA